MVDYQEKKYLWTIDIMRDYFLCSCIPYPTQDKYPPESLGECLLVVFISQEILWNNSPLTIRYHQFMNNIVRELGDLK